MMKKILCLAMTLIMVMGASLTVNAAENEKNWTVRYKGGNKLITELGEGQKDLSLSFSDIEPGESISLEAKMKNDTSKKSDWYLSNDIISVLESKGGKGGAYTYVLTYHGPNNAPAVALYNSSEVGGTDGNESDGLGEVVLHGKDQYIYLDRLNPGEEAAVRLYVKLNGETIVDTYQDSNAALELNFAVEKINEGTITKEIHKVNKETIVTAVPTMVQTGDNANIALFSGITLASGLILVVVALRMLVKRRGEKGEV